MISDTLAAAVHFIERYQQELPDIYDPYFSKINFVKQQMEMLRAQLDLSPQGPDDLQGEWIGADWDPEGKDKIRRVLKLEKEIEDMMRLDLQVDRGVEGGAA